MKKNNKCGVIYVDCYGNNRDEYTKPSRLYVKTIYNRTPILMGIDDAMVRKTEKCLLDKKDQVNKFFEDYHIEGFVHAGIEWIG